MLHWVDIIENFFGYYSHQSKLVKYRDESSEFEYYNRY